MQCINYDSLPFEKLFQIAQQKYQSFQYQQAQYFYHLAYIKNPLNDIVLLCYAHCLKTNNKPQQAKSILQYSLSTNPNGTYKRYFQLAQLYQGISAAQSTLSNPFLTHLDTLRDLAQAHASIAQVCMTDLLDTPAAEHICVQSLQKGLQRDAECVDVHVQSANYHLFKEQTEEARAALMHAHALIIKYRGEFQVVVAVAKLLIEVEEHSKSVELLEQMREDNGNEPEVVYLLAFCKYHLGMFEEAEECLEEYGGGTDEELNCAAQELREALESRKIGEDTVEEEWMDVEDEENDL